MSLNNLFSRFIVFLLVPCLISDPAWPVALSQQSLKEPSPNIRISQQSRFHAQALMTRAASNSAIWNFKKGRWLRALILRRWHYKRIVRRTEVTNLEDYRQAKSGRQSLEHAVDRDEDLVPDLIALLSVVGDSLLEWVTSLSENRRIGAPLGTVVNLTKAIEGSPPAVKRRLYSWRMVWLERVRMWRMHFSVPPESFKRWLDKPLSAEDLTSAIRDISHEQRGLWILVPNRSSKSEAHELWIRSPGFFNWRRWIPEVLVTDRGIAQLHTLLQKELQYIQRTYHSDLTEAPYKLEMGGKGIFGWNIEVKFDDATQLATPNINRLPQNREYNPNNLIPFREGLLQDAG